MSNCLISVLAMGVLVSVPGTALGGIPAYSFEEVVEGGGGPGPDGFFGLGAAVSQEASIGVTHLEHSMRYVAGGGGFVGARSEIVPASLNNPLGVEAVLFDLFIPEIPVGISFADIGVTVFGHDIDNGIFGVQCLFNDSISMTALGVGQHNDLRIDLDNELFSGQSFNDLFGDDPADLDVASAFQFHISKSAGVGMTIFIDNVRFVVPSPGTIALCGVGLGVLGAGRRRANDR